MVDATAPLLRVSRPVSACSRCRSAKVKVRHLSARPIPPPLCNALMTLVGSLLQCDGKLPACSACERAGKAHECTGGSDQFARGKERR